MELTLGREIRLLNRTFVRDSPERMPLPTTRVGEKLVQRPSIWESVDELSKIIERVFPCTLRLPSSKLQRRHENGEDDFQ